MKTVTINIGTDGDPKVSLSYSPDEQIKSITRPELTRILRAVEITCKQERRNNIAKRYTLTH
jgi:hypothetical protein